MLLIRIVLFFGTATPSFIIQDVINDVVLSHQLPNKLVMLLGGLILKVIYTMRQIVFAKGHFINRCCIVSSWSQKQPISFGQVILCQNNFSMKEPHEYLNF